MKSVRFVLYIDSQGKHHPALVVHEYQKTEDQEHPNLGLCVFVHQQHSTSFGVPNAKYGAKEKDKGGCYIFESDIEEEKPPAEPEAPPVVSVDLGVPVKIEADKPKSKKEKQGKQDEATAGDGDPQPPA